jgi:hypothetical protein
MSIFPMSENFVAIQTKEYSQARIDILGAAGATVYLKTSSVRMERLNAKRKENRAVGVGPTPRDRDANLIGYLKALDAEWEREIRE